MEHRSGSNSAVIGLSVLAVAVLELLRGLFPGKKINDIRL
jgi:hypothetical protein